MRSTPFLRFGLSHSLGIAAIAFGMLGVVRLCWRPYWRKSVASTLFAATVLYALQSYWYRRHSLTLASSLPLHLCDLILGLSLVGLARVARGREPGRIVSELLYYWGFGLSIHALLTPDLRDGFPHPRFLEFFWGHGLIFWGLACVATVQGFPWDGRAALRSWLALNVYLVVVGALDWTFGWNYGYLCHRPIDGSVLDLLGPWPIYIVVADMLVGLQFWLLWLPVRWIRPGSA